MTTPRLDDLAPDVDVLEIAEDDDDEDEGDDALRRPLAPVRHVFPRVARREARR